MTLCTLCRRRFLAGERFRYWRTRQRRACPICSLCEASASRAGWAPTGADERESATGLRSTVRLFRSTV